MLSTTWIAVIKIIRGSGSRAEARENLRTWSLTAEIVINLDKDTTNLNVAPGMSYRQIDAVLELQLYG